MKQSTSLSKAWKYTKQAFPNINLSQVPVLIVSVSLFIFSCRLNETSLESNPQLVVWDPTQVFTQSKTNDYAIKSQKNVEIVRLDQLACLSKDPDAPVAAVVPLIAKLKLHSPLGDHAVQFEFALDSAAISIEIDQHKMRLSTPESLPSLVMADFCQQASTTGTRELTDTSAKLESVMQAWLTQLAPDCQITSGAVGFNCQFSQVDPQATEEALNDIRKTMVRSWSRQPYIITRRLSVSVSLAQALGGADPLRPLDTLCRAIAHADPVELPLALANRRWQDVVCYERGAERLAAANLGLSKALMEIEYLRQLFERTSKLGTLTVRVPRDAAPTRDLWINLKPSADVVRELANQTDDSKASANDTAEGGKVEVASGCWHPIFASDAGSMSIARHLELAGESAGTKCEPTQLTPMPMASAPSLYLADSIASETEFVITNGHSKMLRLPAGSYTYEVRGHYEALGWEANSDDRKSTGEIVWSHKRPSATINTW